MTAQNQRKVGHLAIFQAADLQAIENYTERFSYDKANNLLSMQRIGGADFTRTYTVDAHSNRVLAYDKGKDTTAIGYDAAGQMLHLNGSGTMPLEWNIQGNIAKTILVKRHGTDDDAEYYVYSAGLRVRKVKVCYDGNGKEMSLDDKRYLGSYRRTNRKGSDEVRHSITLGGVQKHDCVLQYSTDASKSQLEDTQIFRFQHADHLNSVGLETNLEAQIISYEEYSPFGDTTYSLSLSNLDSSKEFRYSAQEKDDTTGLYYYGYRYYAPWLCRWTRPDPAGTIDGFNLYAFVGNEPVGRVDVMGLKGEKPGTGKKTPIRSTSPEKKVRPPRKGKLDEASIIKRQEEKKKINKGITKAIANYEKNGDPEVDLGRISGSLNTDLVHERQSDRDTQLAITGIIPLMDNAFGIYNDRMKIYREQLKTATLDRANEETRLKGLHVNESEDFDKAFDGYKKNKPLPQIPYDVCHRIPDQAVVLILERGNTEAVKEFYDYHMHQNDSSFTTEMFKELEKARTTNTLNQTTIWTNIKSRMNDAENTFIGDSSTNRRINAGFDPRFIKGGRSMTPRSKRAGELLKKYEKIWNGRIVTTSLFSSFSKFTALSKSAKLYKLKA